MSREETDALARKLLATDAIHSAHILVNGGGVLAETTPEAMAFYEQYFMKEENKSMEPTSNEETGITANAILNNLISFMEQLAASGMEHKDIVSRGYDFALAKLRSKADMELPQGREISAMMLAQIMDHAADLLKAAVGRGIEKPPEQRIRFDPHGYPWPAAVIPWDKVGHQLQDKSVGFVTTTNGRVPVMDGDWIITGVDGQTRVEKD